MSLQRILIGCIFPLLANISKLEVWMYNVNQAIIKTVCEVMPSVT